LHCINKIKFVSDNKRPNKENKQHNANIGFTNLLLFLKHWYQHQLKYVCEITKAMIKKMTRRDFRVSDNAGSEINKIMYVFWIYNKEEVKKKTVPDEI